MLGIAALFSGPVISCLVVLAILAGSGTAGPMSLEPADFNISVGPLELASDDRAIIISTSNDATCFIKGAVHLPSKSFTDKGAIRSAPEIAGIIGDAGITESDPVVLYCDCFPCGDATFVLWVFKYIGHKNVSILQGGLSAWKESGLPVEDHPTKIAPKAYNPCPKPYLLATYEDVIGCQDCQIVDTRSPESYKEDHITYAVNIPYDLVVHEDSLESASAIEETFSNLTKERPVIVYSRRGGQASIVWYALYIMGYDCRLYSWDDWTANQMDSYHS